MRPFTVALAIPLGIVLVSASCAPRRTIRISTVPPGAIVRIDDETVGTTPLDLPFYHYGTRRITLQKNGYRTHSEEVELKPVWWTRFPMDIVSEVLLPFGWKDRRRYQVALVAGSETMSVPSLHSVIERADVLRNAGPDGPRNLPAPQPVELPKVGDDSEDPEDTGDPEQPDEPGSRLRVQRGDGGFR